MYSFYYFGSSSYVYWQYNFLGVLIPKRKKPTYDLSSQNVSTYEEVNFLLHVLKVILIVLNKKQNLGLLIRLNSKVFLGIQCKKVESHINFIKISISRSYAILFRLRDTGRQLPSLSSVLYRIISKRRYILAAQLLLREKWGT